MVLMNGDEIPPPNSLCRSYVSLFRLICLYSCLAIHLSLDPMSPPSSIGHTGHAPICPRSGPLSAFDQMLWATSIADPLWSSTFRGTGHVVGALLQAGFGLWVVASLLELLKYTMYEWMYGHNQQDFFSWRWNTPYPYNPCMVYFLTFGWFWW